MPRVGMQSKSKINRLQAWRDREGRKIPKKDIDLEQVYRMARNMCSIKEMASILGMSEQYMTTLIDGWPELADRIELGYSDTKENMRKVQLELALSGNASMLMWLGKQYLGQSDQHRIENKTTISITVQKAMDELRNIPKDQLLAAQALLSSPVIEHESEPEAATARPPDPPL